MILLIYRVRLYLVFTLSSSFIACHRTRTVHTAIELYDCLHSPFIFTFLLCIQLVYTH